MQKSKSSPKTNSRFLALPSSWQVQQGFTLMELLVVMVILGILMGLVGQTFTTSQQKARDAKRKSDLAQIARALEFYFNDHELYPDDGGGTGNIYACGTLGSAICAWGSEFSDENDTVYMGELPADPRSSIQSYYYWVSTDRLSYQLYARLENDKDIALNFDADENPLFYTDTECIKGLCNYGASSANITPETGRSLVLE